MSKFGLWIETFERIMAAVAFAESNDRETACRMLKPDLSETISRMDKVIEYSGCRPVLRF